MLDTEEIAQARAIALSAQADVYRHLNSPHGKYRHLVELGGVVCFAHTPVGRVLYNLNDD